MTEVMVLLFIFIKVLICFLQVNKKLKEAEASMTSFRKTSDGQLLAGVPLLLLSCIVSFKSIGSPNSLPWGRVRAYPLLVSELYMLQHGLEF